MAVYGTGYLESSISAPLPAIRARPRPRVQHRRCRDHGNGDEDANRKVRDFEGWVIAKGPARQFAHQRAFHPTMNEGIEPNTYQLSGPGALHVQYSTTSIGAQPLLTYQDDDGQQQNFGGDQIVVEQTTVGRLVTVQTGATPDQDWTTFTLLLPRVVLDNSHKPLEVSTLGIKARHRTSIKPATLRGQLDTYEPVPLQGTASLISY
jgi:hypothetical protein